MPALTATPTRAVDARRSPLLAALLPILLACCLSAASAPVWAACDPGQHDFYGTCVEQLSLFGQASWQETAHGAVLGNAMGWHLSGLAIDRSAKPNRIYVADTSNNRILGFRSLGVCSAAPLIACTNDSDCAPAAAGTCDISGEFGWPFNPTFRDADVVIGQPDAHGSACNGDDNVGIYGPATASTLCLMQKPAVDNVAESWQFMNFDVDGQGNLYVTDRHNNRVLGYYQPFSSDQSGGKGDAVADVVFGQPDFTANFAHDARPVGPDTLFLNLLSMDHVAIPSFGGVMTDAQGNVWIADMGNSRVLRFPAGSTVPNLVLGQPDFTTVNPDTLVGPFAMVLDPDRGWLYVLDYDWRGNANVSRLVIFKPDRVTGDFANGMAPKRTVRPYRKLKEPAGWQYSFNALGMTLNRYRKGAYGAGKIWVFEQWPGRRALLLNRNGGFTRGLIGSPRLTSIGGTGWGDMHPECSSSAYEYRLFSPGGSGGIDDDDNLYVADTFPTRVAVYHLPTYAAVEENGTRCPPRPKATLLGQPEPTNDRLLGLTRSAHAAGNQLFVDDWSRILVWNDYTHAAIGAPADVVIDADTNGGRFATVDDRGHLWFANHVFKLPVTPTARTPIASNVPVYWADDPDVQATVIGTPEFDPVSGKLWIADDHRVLRIANATDIESGAKLLADMVIGQTTKTNLCNQGLGAPAANRLCIVRSVRFDRLGNLYVVENDYECHGNDRITMFAAADLAAAQGMFPDLSATRVFGGTMTTPGSCAFSPVAVTFDSANRMVVATDGVFGDRRTRAVRQLFLFPTPLTSQVPSATIRVPMGAPGEIQFDGDDNLVIRDHTWHRAWVVNLDRDPTWVVPE